MNQIQIPLGMRDILNEECEKKKQLSEKIENVFSSYGYQSINTPAIEFYQTYQNAFGDVADEDMYKFFDKDGQILTLRMDMTVPIARLCASKFNNSNPPYRFQYNSNVYKVRQSFGGQRGEVTDCGVELIGLDSSCDLEVLCCALDTIAALGIEDYKLEIGNSDFFKKACELLQLSNEVINTLADLIDRKSLVDLKDYVSTLSLSSQEARFFQALPLLTSLDEALEYSFHPALKAEVRSLQDVSQKLNELGYEEHVSFDLGKVPHLDYYTGIIFEGYVAGVGHSVLSGGRYDSLLKKFGRDLPACGFSVKLDYLVDVVDVELPNVVKLYYPMSQQVEALAQAKELRKEYNVEMIEWGKPYVEVKK